VSRKNHQSSDSTVVVTHRTRWSQPTCRKRLLPLIRFNATSATALHEAKMPWVTYCRDLNRFRAGSQSSYPRTNSGNISSVFRQHVRCLIGSHKRIAWRWYTVPWWMGYCWPTLRARCAYHVIHQLVSVVSQCSLNALLVAG